MSSGYNFALKKAVVGEQFGRVNNPGNIQKDIAEKHLARKWASAKKQVADTAIKSRS